MPRLMPWKIALGGPGFAGSHEMSLCFDCPVVGDVILKENLPVLCVCSVYGGFLQQQRGETNTRVSGGGQQCV